MCLATISAVAAGQLHRSKLLSLVPEFNQPKSRCVQISVRFSFHILIFFPLWILFLGLIDISIVVQFYQHKRARKTVFCGSYRTESAFICIFLLLHNLFLNKEWTEQSSLPSLRKSCFLQPAPFFRSPLLLK